MCRSHNPARIDKCLANLIFRLNQHGIHTLASCCGHSRYPISIIVKDELGIYDMVSDIEIPRKKRFYRKDKDGYYYIPEVIKKEE